MFVPQTVEAFIWCVCVCVCVCVCACVCTCVRLGVNNLLKTTGCLDLAKCFKIFNVN